MTGQAPLHSSAPEHTTSGDDSHDLLLLHEEGQQDGVAPQSNANDVLPESDGEAGDIYSGKGEEKKRGKISQEFVSSIKSDSTYNSRLAIHVSCFT